MVAHGGRTVQSGLMDLGPPDDYTPYLSDFSGTMQDPETPHVRVGDGVHLPVKGMGIVQVQGKDGTPLTLTKVHWVPAISSRLISVSHLTACGAKVVFAGGTCSVHRGNRVLIEGQQSSTDHYGLYKLHLPLARREEAQVFLAAAPMEVVHRRLVHSGVSTIREMVRQDSVTGLKVLEGEASRVHKCQTCQECKAKRLPFPAVSHTKVTQLLGLVHADLWGPVRVGTVGRGSIYVLSLMDHLSGMVWALQLPNKAAATVLQVLQEWVAMAQRSSGNELKVLRTDNGTEFKGEVRGVAQVPGRATGS